MKYLFSLFILLSTILSYSQEDIDTLVVPNEQMDSVQIDSTSVDTTTIAMDSLSLDSAAIVLDTIPTYQSLFWKIEHPNYEKPSYLYGTMHVSHKIAYHLNDPFFQALKDVDQIALETNPEDWMDKMLERNSSSYNGRRNGGLYENFAPFIPEKDDLKSMLQMNNQIVNSILYRNNEYQQNFEEETYLDMFIFQAGGKMGKPVLALEDIDEADILAKKASVSAYDAKREHSPWLKKKLQESGVVELTEDAYRDKNLDLIDSLNREYYPFEYNDFMLYQRNWNMVVALDSVLENGTVLIGIGAAHLPGEDGVIDMLRKKGFTVTAIEGELTEKGTAIKEEFENSFAEREHSIYQSADDYLSLSLPDELYEFSVAGRNIGLSMDITNGAYFLIFRTSRYTELTKEILTIEDIEGMLYENIPGKIKEQERITFQGYPALTISNETKSGEHQKYLIILTDLEIIILKLGGKKDYASINKDKFFDNIKLKENQSEAEVSPFYGDFKINMPSTPIIHGNSDILSLSGAIEMQSIDTTNGAYYFARSLVYHDLKYFEEDEFEVEFMHKIWYDELDTTHVTIETNLSDIPYCISSSSTTDGKNIWLKSIKKGHRYYMLGTVGADSIQAHDYFNSFEYVPFIHEEEKFEERLDTALLFKVIAPVEAPPFFDYYGPKEDADTIGNIYKSVTYETPYKEFINVNYRKYHSYYQVEHVDSIWTRIDRRWSTDEDKENGLEQFEKVKGETEEGYPTYQFKVKQKGSSRIIHNHYYLNHGLMYLLQYDSDKFAGTSPFIDQFIETFEMKDTIVGMNPIDDKTELFFENIYSTDSLTRASSLESYNYIDFTKDDIPQLIEIIKNFEFTDKELKIKVGILEDLGSLEDPRVFAFLRDLYINSEYNSIIQLEVISALINSPSEVNMKSILSLMKEDIPLSSQRIITNTFAPLSDSLALGYSKLLFPEIMEYSSIPEYKTWIYRLAVLLKDSGMIKPKLFKKYNKQLIVETKIEFKRQKTKDLNKKSNGSSNYGGSSSLLNEYISLLVPCYKNAEVKDLFDKISTLESPWIRSVLQAQLARNNFAVNDTLIQNLAEDPKTRKYLFDSFNYMEQIDKFPIEYLNQKDIAESFLISSSSYPKVDSTEFIKEILIEDRDDKYVIYFFKVRKKGSNYGYYEEEEKDEWGIQYVAYHLKEGEDIVKKYYTKSSYKEIDFDDISEMKDFEKKATEKVKYMKRRRVVFNSGGYYDEY